MANINGTSNDDTLPGTTGVDTINGLDGDDRLEGGAGDGADNLLHGGDGEDVIDLTEFTGINSMEDLDITSHGNNVRIELSGTDYLTTIILSDFDINNLDNSDFLF